MPQHLPAHPGIKRPNPSCIYMTTSSFGRWEVSAVTVLGGLRDCGAAQTWAAGQAQGPVVSHVGFQGQDFLQWPLLRRQV